MKKLVSKLRRTKQPEEPAGRITTDTLAEHREQVLAGGRKFKYPVQYHRHKLVLNATLISVAALALLIGMGWYLLYAAQNSSEFIYRVTKVVPVPVAVVDGEQVRYSDFLMKYRGNKHYLVEKEQIDIRSDDGKSQLAYVKSQAMNDAIADAYAVKLARELDITVSEADIEVLLKQQRQLSDGEVSEATYNASISDYYGWSPEEYREAMKSKILRQKVAYATDTTASKLSETIAQKLKAGSGDVQSIAAELNAATADAVQYMGATWVPKTNQDGGLAVAAASLQKGQVSSAIKNITGDGYYFVKLIDSNDSQVQYEYIRVPLTAFAAKLQKVKDDNKLTQLIKIDNLAE